MGTRQLTRDPVDRRFARILGERDLRTLFQPIVGLDSGFVIGYEALLRGPDDPDLGSAPALVAAAQRAGRLVELDWAARASACRAALEADLDVGCLLFLNIEPIALDTDCPPDLWPVIDAAFRRFRVVMEVTERSLDRDPGTLLDGVERQRHRVTGIAIDDCGSNPATLAMLPLVSPNVIKIDASVIRSEPDARTARVLSTIVEQAARTGAVIVAEGVETAEHRDRAAALGTEFGQGYLFGRPQELPRGGHATAEAVSLTHVAPTVVESPFAALGGRTLGRAGEDLLTVLMREVGACADVSSPTVHVTLLPRAELFDEAARARKARLTESGTFAGVLGPGIPDAPGAGIRGVGTRRVAPPADEWAAVTLGPCATMAVMARRVPGQSDEWEYGVTHDRSRAIAAARSLVRLLGSPRP